jgi:adenosine/AMP kinase
MSRFRACESLQVVLANRNKGEVIGVIDGLPQRVEKEDGVWRKKLLKLNINFDLVLRTRQLAASL